MNRIDDQKVRSAFGENDERPIVEDFEKKDLWLKIERNLQKRSMRHLNWYRSAAAILVLVVLSGWSITLLKYNQIKTENRQLTSTIEEKENALELQKKQISASIVNPDKEISSVGNKDKLEEKSIENVSLLSENAKLKAEKESLARTNASLQKQLHILSQKSNILADSLRLITKKISETEELPRVTIEPPHEPGKKADTKIDDAYSPKAKAKVYMSDLPAKRPGRRLKIQIFNPGEPFENNPTNDVSIFKLFK